MAMKASSSSAAKFLTEVKASDAFAASRGTFKNIVEQLQGTELMRATESMVEEWLDVEGRELLRQLFQDHLRLRKVLEPQRLSVVGSEGIPRREVVADAERDMPTIFGEVEVERLAYRAPRKGVGNLMPLDCELNMPAGLYSFGLQRRVAIEIAKSSFESTQEAIKDRCGVVIGKKQLEDMVSELASDFDLFYGTRSRQAMEALEAICGSPEGITSPRSLDRSKLLVITTDAKGVSVVEEDLREETRKAAQKRRQKMLKTDPMPEQKTPKCYRRRMAQVCAVYTIAPFVRVPEDVIRELRHLHPVGSDVPARPRPENKRVWAKLVDDAKETIEEAFVEALRRDPKREMKWVVVVDGSDDQLRNIRRCARRYHVKVTLVLDFIHLAGYLWKASEVFHPRGSEAAQRWVDERLLAILHGQASTVAAGMRRSATLQKLPKAKRKAVDQCCDYLLGHASMLRYHEYLAMGCSIATGVVEGACRHLIQDRLDLSGATWTAENAEAVLKLRALRSSDDFDEYWRFHEEEELKRNHLARFKDSKPPPRPPRRSQSPRLSLVP